MNSHQPQLDILYTSRYEEALRYAQQGYEPIECAFGSHGSVLGPLNMDHHGSEAWREGVALRACRDHYGALRSHRCFVVTGTPDADAVLAIVALAGLVPEDKIPSGFYELVNRHDLDPIHMTLLNEPWGEELLSFQQLESLRRDALSLYRAVDFLVALLNDGLASEQRQQIRHREERRINLAKNSICEELAGRVLFVQSRVWGFDVWYQQAPVVVSFSQRFQSVTIGCKDTQTAESIFGPGGLLRVFKLLGEGWGGRESIGGSPRGDTLSFEEARKVAAMVASVNPDELPVVHKESSAP